jgi:DNA-binding response OmpR family regulator
MDNIINVADKQKTVIGNYVFDFELGEFSVGGRKVILDELQQALLKTLISNKGVVLRKRALVDRLRSVSLIGYIDESVLSEMIDELTDRLCAGNYIKTVYGIGYMWIKYDENTAVF